LNVRLEQLPYVVSRRAYREMFTARMNWKCPSGRARTALVGRSSCRVNLNENVVQCQGRITNRTVRCMLYPRSGPISQNAAHARRPTQHTPPHLCMSAVSSRRRLYHKTQAAREPFSERRILPVVVRPRPGAVGLPWRAITCKEPRTG
jgi:hypothetical protein